MNRTYTLIIQEEAKLDINDAFEWYESKQNEWELSYKMRLFHRFVFLESN